jgi:4-hydroxyphenylpyruvate dioxygenase
MDQDKKCLVNKIDHIEVATLNLSKLEKLFEGFGFYCTQLRENADGVSRLMEQGHVKILLTKGAAGSFAHSYAQKHGDGVCRLSFSVDNADEAFKKAVSRGAQPLEDYKSQSESQLGAQLRLAQASIASFGDVRATFVERHVEGHFAASHTKPFMPGFVLSSQSYNDNPNDVGLKSCDHLTNNVEMGKMDYWSDFYARIYGFIETRYFDIKASKTGLHSKVMQSPNGAVKIPINEATEEKSQIQEFIDQHKGAGVQHIALTTNDIVASVRELRKRGFQFLDVPDTYYEAIPSRIPQLEENLEDLKELKILVDGDETGYLLQIFTQNQIGPLFFELIQRKGHKGFGEGNFRALFEAIERDQERRGVL